MKISTKAWLQCVALFVVSLALQPLSSSARDLLPAGDGATWTYLDDGMAPAANWNQPNFDDSRWNSGPAPLGYGEARIKTQLRAGSDPQRQAIAAWFRCAFHAPQLEPNEKLVILLCVDDGAIVYLNGHEVGRQNMPQGPHAADTLALQVLGDDDEGFYSRLHVPPAVLLPGQRNVLAVEVHQGATRSSDLFLDLVLKTLPADAPTAAVADEARQIVELYNKQHYVGPGVTIPDGYVDGGRGMTIDENDNPASGREILCVDRSRDKELADDLAFARSPELRALPPLERVQRIAAHIDQHTTPPGGIRWVVETTTQLEQEFASKPLLIGDWLDQCHAGVCRHRALLFKVLADEAGLNTALVRGNYASRGPPGGAHAWNEVILDDGRRLLVDVMHHGGEANFPEVTTPQVVERYLKVDGSPWYRPDAD